MLLLIPGPVSTRPRVKAAMTGDIAPWDIDSAPLHRRVIGYALATAGVERATHSCIPLQGAGHFGVEAMMRAFVGRALEPGSGRVLVPLTGAYGVRMARLAREAGCDVVTLPVAPDQPVDPGAIAAALTADPTLSHIGLVYSETSTGVIHDAAAIGAVVRAAGRTLLLDAVSAFGALPLDLAAMPEVAAMVFTANKCFEGMPGLCFILARNDALEGALPAHSWSLDLGDIWRQRGRLDGFFRFTPPVQVMAALDAAMADHAEEGGSTARLARYGANRDALMGGFEAIGLTPCLSRAVQGPIVVNIQAPGDDAWDLQRYVAGLKSRDYLISNFHDTVEPSFRVGCIGAVEPTDMTRFVAAADATLTEMGIRQRAPRQLGVRAA